MSSGESNRTQTVEDVKTELRTAVKQLAEMARSDSSFDQFCETLLQKLVKLTGAHGAVIWQLTTGSNCQITHQHIPVELKQPINVNANRDVALEVINNDQPMVVSSDRLTAESDQAGEDESSACLLILSPIRDRSGQCRGSLQLIQRSQINEQAKEGYQKFVHRIAELFQRWHEHHDLERLSYNAKQLTTTMDYVGEVHKSIDFKTTAFAIANEARRLMGSDRVTVARWNGSRAKITAVSSQDRFDNRANVVRKLSNLATACIASGTTLWLTGETDGLPPEIVKVVNDYLDEAHSRTLAVIPLSKKPETNPELEFKPGKKGKPKKLGALIIEFFDEDVDQSKVIDSVQLIKQHAELATANALEHDEILLRPLWKRLGELNTFLFRDHIAKTLTAIAALLLFTLYLIFFPAELKMRVNGVIQPEQRKNIFAQTEGIVSTIHIDQGESVTAGQTLIELTDPDLEISIEEAKGQLEVVNKQLREVESQLARIREVPENDRIGIWGRKDQLDAQFTNLNARLKLLNRKKNLQIIKSPINGKVVTWDAKKRLESLPITKNQFVLAIADFEGEWLAELRIPQNQVGYVVKALNESDNRKLDVEFRVATNPNILFYGQLVRLADRTDPGQSGVPEFRAIVKADVSRLKELRPGAGLTAKIHCGQTSTGFVWFYQVIDYLRTKIFF